MKRVERSVLSLLQLLVLVFVWQGDSLRPSAHTDGGYVMGRRVAEDCLHNSLFLEDSQVNTVDSRILDSKGQAQRVSSVATPAKNPVRSGSHLHDIQA